MIESVSDLAWPGNRGTTPEVVALHLSVSMACPLRPLGTLTQTTTPGRPRGPRVEAAATGAPETDPAHRPVGRAGRQNTEGTIGHPHQIGEICSCLTSN